MNAFLVLAAVWCCAVGVLHGAPESLENWLENDVFDDNSEDNFVNFNSDNDRNATRFAHPSVVEDARLLVVSYIKTKTHNSIPNSI